MRTRKHRLDKVGLVAKGKVDAAANRLRDARHNEAEQQSRLDQLIEFSREFDQFLDRRDSDTLSPRQLEEYRRFMHRLHGAVDQQSQTAAATVDAVASSSAEWKQASLYERTLKNLITQQNAEATRAEEKKEQAKLDATWKQSSDSEF
jgi:flagellar export protein FliJ